MKALRGMLYTTREGALKIPSDPKNPLKRVRKGGENLNFHILVQTHKKSLLNTQLVLSDIK